jgi:hypothetical protein
MRLSPGWFKHRNSEVWWNCLRSAVSIIDTSDERHSTRSCSPDHSPYTSQLKKIWQANQLIRRSVEKIRSADFILEIEAKRTSSGRNFTTARFWRTTVADLDIKPALPAFHRVTVVPSGSDGHQCSDLKRRGLIPGALYPVPRFFTAFRGCASCAGSALSVDQSRRFTRLN